MIAIITWVVIALAACFGVAILLAFIGSFYSDNRAETEARRKAKEAKAMGLTNKQHFWMCLRLLEHANFEWCGDKEYLIPARQTVIDECIKRGKTLKELYPVIWEWFTWVPGIPSGFSYLEPADSPQRMEG